MSVLEKILQEIEERIENLNEDAGKYEDSGAVDLARLNDREIYGLKTASNIIRSHMEDEPASNPYKLDEEWIPVTERLPEEKIDVLCFYRNRAGYEQMTVGFIKGKTWWPSEDGDEIALPYDDPVAWQPLPAPYQPKEGRNE